MNHDDVFLLSLIVGNSVEPLFPVSIIASSRHPFHHRLREWFQEHSPWLLRGAAIPYRMLASARRKAYQRDWLRQHHLPKPVVSVGNLTVGGTGKTPLVIWLAQQLHSNGQRVAILSRGYGRQAPSGNVMVSDGTGLVKDWRMAGDEPWMIAMNCPWAIVAVGPDRHSLGQWVLEQMDCDYFILDDGYQHLSLYRDLDVLLFDTTDVKGLAGVLPAGRLREPLDGMNGAEAFVFTRADSQASIESVRECIEDSLGQSISPIILKSVLKRVEHLVTGQVRVLDILVKTPLLVISGIGNPQSFCEMLKRSGSEVCEEIQFPDHCDYGQNEIDVIRKTMKLFTGAIAVTTEKDAVKLREWFTEDDPFFVINMKMEFLIGEDHLQNLCKQAGLVAVD